MILRKRHLIIGAAVLFAAIILVYGSINTDHVITTHASTKELPIYCVDRTDKKVALTFDAAWGAEDTQKLIDILSEKNAKATFFVVGEWVDKYADSVKAIYNAGHDVMNHSNTHPHFTKISNEEIEQEAKKASDKIELVTGERPTLLRLPYGDYNDRVIVELRKEGYTPIQWDVDSLDWKGISAKEIINRVTKRVKSGSIVLFHNAAEHTPEALPEILERLEAEGYQFVTVRELLLTGDYYIDHTGKQVPIGEQKTE